MFTQDLGLLYFHRQDPAVSNLLLLLLVASKKNPTIRGKRMEIGVTEIWLGDVHWVKPPQDEMLWFNYLYVITENRGEFLNL